MSNGDVLASFNAGTAQVQIYRSPSELGYAAAQLAAKFISEAIRSRGRARVIVATGNSQLPFAEALVKQPIEWNAVELFHMDEYVGIAPDHPSSFRFWIKKRIVDVVHPGQTHYLDGDAPDLSAERKRYSQLLLTAPIDLAFVGFGENGHIAFNDPPVADFSDPATVKRVELDESCRRQQAGEGHFANIDSVPTEAITVTCTGLFRAGAWVSCVPEARKAEAVRNALEEPISERCPASLVRRHPKAHVFLDSESAARLRSVEQSLEASK